MQRHPDASEKTQRSLARIVILIAAVLGILATSFMPAIINGANWAFAWLCPIFFNVMYALFWKRSNAAAGAVFAVSWILVLLWTFTPFFTAIGLGGIPIPYVTLAVSIVLGVILNLVLPGKTGYFRERRALRESA
jgi:SSS family solute:Na+ symporter